MHYPLSPNEAERLSALAELHRLLPHRLMTDHDPSGGEHLLDHAQAERKSEIQPHSMADDFSRESVTGVARMARWFHPLPVHRSGHPLVNLTVPFSSPEGRPERVPLE
jgi:hypothetical protein